MFVASMAAPDASWSFAPSGVTGWQEHVGSLDGQRVVRRIPCPKRNACSEGHVHTKANYTGRKGAFEPFVSDDESFALEADDAAVDHVKCDQTLDRLLGVDEGGDGRGG